MAKFCLTFSNDNNIKKEKKYSKITLPDRMDKMKIAGAINATEVLELCDECLHCVCSLVLGLGTCKASSFDSEVSDWIRK